MQLTLFTDYFLSELEKSDGFLSQPLKILFRFMQTPEGLEVLSMIKSDQKSYAEFKKLKRGNNLPLCNSGRPPLDPCAVLILLVCRGFISGVYGERSYGFLKENKAVLEALSHFGISKFPGRSTIHENINLLSEVTLQHILISQAQIFEREGLDNFETVTIDSTSVTADSAPPNTARLISFLTTKILKILSDENIPLKRLTVHCNKIMSLSFDILSCGRFKRIKQRRKTLNRALISRIDKVLKFLETKKIDSISQKAQDAIFPLYQQLDEMYFQVTKEFFPERYQGEVDKRYSISDEQASFIKKGMKPAVFGYKFHMARSKNGFICGVVLNEKNPSDSKCFKQVVEDVQKTVNKTPKQISVDSGYCSNKNKIWALEQGIEQVSFSGGKGKKLLSEEEWTNFKYLRDFRATSEGLFSILKDSFDLRRFTVRGNKKIKKALLEKVIAFNFENSARVALKQKRKMAA